MFNLPKGTEINQRIQKTKIFEANELKPSEKKLFDNTISSLIVVNQISKNTIPSLSDGEKIHAINIVVIELKNEYNNSLIDIVFKSINQTMILILHINNNYIVAVKYDEIILTKNIDKDISLLLNGNNMDEIYENLIKDLLNIKNRYNNTLEEQIKENEDINKIQQEIWRLELKRDREVQFNKKVKYNVEINKLKKELEKYK